MQTLERTFNAVVAMVTTLLVVLGLLFIAHYFYSLVTLLGVVLVLTYILLAPVGWAQYLIEWVSKKSKALPVLRWPTQGTPDANPRILAVIVVYFVFFMIITMASLRFVPQLNSEIKGFGNRFTQVMDHVSHVLVDWSDKSLGMETLRQIFGEDMELAGIKPVIAKPLKPLPVPPVSGVPIPEQQPSIKEMAQTIQEKAVIEETVTKSTVAQAMQVFESAVQGTVDNIVTLTTGTLNGFVYFLAVLLLVFFLLLDGHVLKRDFLQVLPDTVRNTTDYFLNSFHEVMFSFVKGQVLLGIMTGIYMFFVYSFLGVPFPFFLGSVFAVAEFLPVVGTYLGIAPGIVVALFSGDPLDALWIFGFSYAYQNIKDNIIAPKVVGDVMGLHPMVIIVALLVCAQIAGLVGILLALPVASAINVIVRYVGREMDKDTQEGVAG